MSNLHSFTVTYEFEDNGEWSKQVTEVRGHSESHAAAVFGALLIGNDDGMDGVDMLCRIREVSLCKAPIPLSELDFDAEFDSLTEKIFTV